MKVFTNVLDVVPDFKENDYLKGVIISVSGNAISYVTKNSSGKFVLRGINVNYGNAIVTWSDSFNSANSVMQLMINETEYCKINEYNYMPIYYIISNIIELNNFINIKDSDNNVVHNIFLELTEKLRTNSEALK